MEAMFWIQAALYVTPWWAWALWALAVIGSAAAVWRWT